MVTKGSTNRAPPKRAGLRALVFVATLLVLSGAGSALVTSPLGVYGAWRLEVVDPGSGTGSEIALDTQGNPRVVELARVGADGSPVWHFAHFTRVGGVWLREDFGDGIIGDIAIDSQDRSHVVTTAFGYGPIVYGVRESDGWRFETISVESAGDIRLRLDASGSPHVVFHGLGGKKYAWRDAATGEWSVEFVTGDNSLSSQLALYLDANETPFIATQMGHFGPVLIWKRLLTGWVYEQVPGSDGTWYHSFALAPNGDIELAIYNGTGLWHVAKHSGAWMPPMQIDRANFGEDVIIGVALDGTPHVAYTNHPHFNALGSNLWHGVLTPSGWKVEIVDGTDDETGINPSMALDAWGMPHITYQLIRGTVGNTISLPDQIDVTAFDVRYAEPALAALTQASGAVGAAQSALT